MVATGYGILLGAISPQPLYSVEIAQVIAGVVVLPSWSPAAIHHDRAFSLVIDAAAVLLRIGFSEDAVCRLFTVQMAVLNCVAIAVMAFAITRSRRVAYLMPLWMIGYSWGGDLHRYAMAIPIGQGDLGSIGPAISILALGLIALHRREGLLLLGLLPGVHIAMAVATWIIVGAGLLFDAEVRATFARHAKAFAAGLGVVMVAWLAHQILAPQWSVPAQPVDESYVRGFMRYWDVHRSPHGEYLWSTLKQGPVDLVFFALAAYALASGLATRAGIRFWLLGAMVMALPAIANSIIDEVAYGTLPVPLSALMMSRWLNLNSLVVPSLAVAVFLAAIPAGWHARLRQVGRGRMVAIGLLLLGLAYQSEGFVPSLTLRDPDDAPLRETLRTRPGLLLDVTPVLFKQLHTGRPQLLDLEVADILPYAPAAGPMMEAILRDAFGASMLKPQWWEAQLTDLHLRLAARSVRDWEVLREKYGVTDVLLPSDFPPLTIPVVAQSPAMTLYTITAP